MKFKEQIPENRLWFIKIFYRASIRIFFHDIIVQVIFCDGDNFSAAHWALWVKCVSTFNIFQVIYNPGSQTGIYCFFDDRDNYFVIFYRDL